MASTVPGRTGRREKADKSEDSVEADFGGDNSEETLELIRYLGRKDAKFGEVEPSEAAVEPISQADIDAVKADLESYNNALDSIRRHVPDAAEREWVEYRRALVEGATPEELTWLKLKAYYHAMDSVRASGGQNAFGEPAGLGTSYGISPVRQAALAAGASGAGAAEPSAAMAADQVLRAARDLLPSSSSEADADLSEGEAQEQQQLRRRASHALAASSPAGIATNLLLAHSDAEPDEALAAEPVTLYHPDYLEEQRLEQKLEQQRRQRSQAFALGLAVVLGMSVVRWWVQRRKARRGGPTEPRRRQGPAMPQ